VGQRTINYRWDFDGKRTAYVQLLSNPVSWGMALLAVAASLWMLVSQLWRPASMQPARRDLMAMLLLLYVVLMAIHAYLGRSRVMYLYHYFLALLPAYCLLPLVIDEAADRWQLFRRYQVPALTGVTVLLLASFLFYAPLTFHQKLTRQQCELRNVFQQVVVCQPVARGLAPEAKRPVG
jgi:dolichyl-phosphate-mannose--protein O-mannosyl transferase